MQHELLNGSSQASNAADTSSLNIGWWYTHPAMTQDIQAIKKTLYYGNVAHGRRIRRIFISAFLPPQYSNVNPTVKVICQQWFNGYSDIHLQPRSIVSLSKENIWTDVSCFPGHVQTFQSFTAWVDLNVDIPADGYVLVSSHLDQNLSQPAYFSFCFTLEELQPVTSRS